MSRWPERERMGVVMGVLERDWEREDARRREALPHVPTKWTIGEPGGRVPVRPAMSRTTTGPRSQPNVGRRTSQADYVTGLILALVALAVAVALLFLSGALVITFVPGT